MRKKLFVAMLVVGATVFPWKAMGQTNLALSKTAVGSSTASTTYAASKAVDGSSSTQWRSNSQTNPWIYVDLGVATPFNKVKLNWSTYYGSAYKIQTSSNATTWTDLATLTAQNGGLDSLVGLSGNARYVRLYVTTRSNTTKGVYLNEIEIYNVDTQAPTSPSSLAVSNETVSSFNLAWSSSTDNVGVVSYEVFQNGISIGTTTSTSMNVSGLICGTTYSMTVTAKDAAGNVSAASTATNGTTSSCQIVVNNSSFESPAIPLGSFTTNVSDIYWTYTGGSGLLSNGSAYANPSSPDGTQAAFVQKQSSISQPVSFNAGTYAIKFKVANRAGFGNQSINVSVGSTVVATYTINSADYQTFTTPAFTVAAGTQTIKFTGLNTDDNTAFIDDVCIVVADTEAPTAPTGIITYGVSQNGLVLIWSASTDNSSVYSYEVFDGTTSLGTTFATYMNIDGFTCNTSHALTVKAKDPAGNVSAASVVMNVTTTACGTGNNILNYSFENPTLPLRTYSYNPTDANWTFNGSSGLITNGCAFYNPDSPTGNQAAFVQSQGSISQTITIPSTGTYIMSFQAAGRSGFANQTIQVTAGSTLIGTYTLTNNSYQYFTTSTFTAAAGSLTITITGQVVVDATAFIDDINVDVPDTQAPSTPTGLTASAVEQNTFTLSWNASTDNVGVVAYDVYCNGILNATVTSSTVAISNLTDTTAYAFTVKARDLAGNISATSSTLNVTTLAWPKYKIGTNFWNLGWGIWDDCFQSNIDWTTTTNPWNAQFLADLATYNGPIRFMDWCGANNQTDSVWSTRTTKTQDQYLATINNHSIAWEWMIDLCNRTNHDMWINVPYKTGLEYWTQLATLIKNNLNSNLKVYVEYANETWNGGMMSFGYVIDHGRALGMPPTDNMYYQGGAYSLYQSLNIWNAFQSVYGASDMGTRVIRTYAFSGNFDIAERAYINILLNGGTTWNPGNQVADIFAIAPYIGPYDDAIGDGSVIDGAASNIATRFRINVDWNFTHYVTPAVDLAKKYNKPLCAYECGQQLNTGAGAWSANQDIYTEYTYMFNKWKQAKFTFVNHYTHTGNYYPSGAWGAKATINSTLAESPKFRAIVDWLADTNTAMARNAQESSINESLANGIKVYPNPATDYVQIDLPKESSTSELFVTISSISGKVVLKERYYKTSHISIKLSSLPKGIYLLNTKTGTKTNVTKLVIR